MKQGCGFARPLSGAQPLQSKSVAAAAPASAAAAVLAVVVAEQLITFFKCPCILFIKCGLTIRATKNSNKLCFKR